MRRIALSCPREGQAEDFADGCHFLMPQDEKQEGGMKEGGGGREEGEEGQGSEPGLWQNPPRVSSPFLAH